MKLLTRTILFNISISLVVLFLGEVAVYRLLLFRLDKEVAEHLGMEARMVRQRLRQGVPAGSFAGNIGDRILVSERQNAELKQPVLQELAMEEEEEEDEGPEHFFIAKAIVFDAQQGGRFYRISIIKTIDEDEGLGGNFIFDLVVSGLSMFALLFAGNWLFFRRALRPLKETIKNLERFSVSEKKELSLSHTRTAEIRRLNEALEEMSKKIVKDYRLLKEFTEDTSHEIQTPLAIINSKIEMCLQDRDLTENQARHLSEALQSVRTLTGINQGLILLTKLDNNQFDNRVHVDFNSLFRSRLALFEDFTEEKGLEVTVQDQGRFECEIHSALAEMLADNLLRNAIRYNLRGGKINIVFSPRAFSISNSGKQDESLKGKDIFSRFIKGRDAESLGLGLAIVKKICDVNRLKPAYAFDNGMHRITISKVPR